MADRVKMLIQESAWPKWKSVRKVHLSVKSVLSLTVYSEKKIIMGRKKNGSFWIDA